MTLEWSRLWRSARATLFALVASHAASAFAADDDLERAHEAVRAHAYKRAVDILSPLAEQGDVIAQREIARIHLNREWFQRDRAVARTWLERAAAQGDPTAQFELAEYFHKHEGNDAEALARFRRVADDFPAAPVARAAAEYVGVLLAAGRGAPRDLAEAARWYRRSAEAGGRFGQFLLGRALFDGRGVDKDAAQGMRWLVKAAEQKDDQARQMLFFIHAEGFDTRRDAIEAAYWATGRRTTDAAEAAHRVGLAYWSGLGPNWYDEERQAAVFNTMAWLYQRRGDSEADAQAKAKEDAEGSWRDATEALYWWRVGAQGGSADAQARLGSSLLDKDNFGWDCAEGVRLTRLAAEQGHVVAMFKLGVFLMEGVRERVKPQLGIGMARDANGVRIVRVLEDSAAAQAGLLAGDVVVRVDQTDAPHRSKIDWMYAHIDRAAGKTMTLHVRREGTSETGQVIASPRSVHQTCPGGETPPAKENPVEAVNWFEKASAAGNTLADFFLAGAYRTGRGASKDLTKALALYEKSARTGEWVAARALYEIYRGDELGSPNTDLAEKWKRETEALRLKAKIEHRPWW